MKHFEVLSHLNTLIPGGDVFAETLVEYFAMSPPCIAVGKHRGVEAIPTYPEGKHGLNVRIYSSTPFTHKVIIGTQGREENTSARLSNNSIASW